MTVCFTPIADFDEEQRALSLLTASEREDYRRRQFAYRCAMAETIRQADRLLASTEIAANKALGKSSQKKRQAANRSEKIAKDQALRTSRSGRNSKKSN